MRKQIDRMAELIAVYLEQRDLLGEALEYIEDCDSYSPQAQIMLEERIRNCLEREPRPSNSEE